MNQVKAVSRPNSVLPRVLRKIAALVVYVAKIPFTPASHRRAARPPNLPHYLRDDVGLPPREERNFKDDWKRYPPL